MSSHAISVAALCVSGRSIYKHLPDVLAYDSKMDARQFNGRMPVIAHPPCRCWSKFLSHQAKPKDRSGEMALGLWCAETVKKNGGVLEQPAFSKLFAAANLPKPGDMRNPLCYTIYIEQGWFGFRSRKATWLLVCGVPISSIPTMPFCLITPRDKLFHQNVSRETRSRTMPELAKWLCQIARLAKPL